MADEMTFKKKITQNMFLIALSNKIKYTFTYTLHIDNDRFRGVYITYINNVWQNIQYIYYNIVYINDND